MGFDFGRHGNVQVAYGLQSHYDSATVQTFGLSYSLSIGALGYLGFFASHSIAGEQDTSLLLNWTLALGDRRTLSASLQQSSGASGGFQATTSLQRDLPAGSGTGYRVALRRLGTVRHVSARDLCPLWGGLLGWADRDREPACGTSRGPGSCAGSLSVVGRIAGLGGQTSRVGASRVAGSAERRPLQSLGSCTVTCDVRVEGSA